MLLVLMYHRIINSDPNAAEKFSQHITRLAQTFPIVVPGEHLPSGQLSVCLTFDDAYYDFYHFVYPLLLKLNIKAVLAVPTKFILPETKIAEKIRLDVPYQQTMNDTLYQTHAPFCTWREIKAMAESQHVIISSHSHNHVDMTQPETNNATEIAYSKKMLEENIGQRIATFVYPYGKMTRTLNKKVKQHYTYAMRIGSSLNANWQNATGIMYRVNADPFWMNNIAWRRNDTFKYGLKFLSNVLRLK